MKKDAQVGTSESHFRTHVIYARCVAVAAHDGTNTGISTAATPIGKKKVIPNLRKNSEKKRGGQPGHTKHFLQPFEQQDVTETVTHSPEGICASCGGQLSDSGETVAKDEYDVEIRTVKRRHEYRVCHCTKCGAAIREPIPGNLKESNQYGSHVQALALSLMNTGIVRDDRWSNDTKRGIHRKASRPCGYRAFHVCGGLEDSANS